MNRDAYIINTARGEVIDEFALAEALEDGSIGGQPWTSSRVNQ